MGRFEIATVSALFFMLCGAGNAQHRAETRIGELALAHDTAIWRVEGSGDRFTLSCLAETCERAVFAVEIGTRSEGDCGEEEVRKQAEVRFTFADRHPVNTFNNDRFALVMGESRNGPDFFVEEAVFACLTRDDTIYRFISVPQSGKYPSHTGGILLALLHGGLRMPPPKLHRLELGDLSFTYASDRWRPFVPATETGASLICLAPTCSGPFATLGIELLPEEVPCPRDRELFYEAWQADGEVREIIAGTGAATIRFRLHQFWSGCRNWTPPHMVACTVHDGRAYRVSAGGAMGCKSYAEVPEEAFTDLLKTAQPR